MLQRIQTVYLILAVIAQFLFNVLSIASFTKNDFSWELSAYAFKGSQEIDVPLYFISFGGVAINILALATAYLIFLFKKRRLQLKLAHVIYFLLLVLTVAMYFNLNSIREILSAQYGELEVSYNLSSYLPVIAIAFILLAIRSIKKDEELVRSLDRIR
ncbi:MAG: DUF4293 domain-containing protein [Luteibaculum sp.]